ncbi:MAG: HlyD family efflux transporter periplasmic adaptor subunit [Candidatus Limivicinus sp.]
MEFKPKNREWVKNAAIVFLAVLLVLTFFSNTIMNRTLPEVATAAVTDGSIVAKVRGSGTVKANGNHDVKATQTREIRSVMVKVGQEVKTGDPLFVLGAGDSAELEAAKETLRDLQYAYQKAAVNMPTFNNTAEYRAVETARRNLEAAQSAEKRAEDAYDVIAARLGVDDGKFNDDLQNLKDAQDDLEKAYANLVEVQKSYDARYLELSQIVDECQKEYNKLLEGYEPSEEPPPIETGGDNTENTSGGSTDTPSGTNPDDQNDLENSQSLTGDSTEQNDQEQIEGASLASVGPKNGYVNLLAVTDGNGGIMLLSSKDEEIAAAKNKLINAQNDLNAFVQSNKATLSNANSVYETAKAKYDALSKYNNEKYFELVPYREAIEKAKAERITAENAYNDALANLNFTQASNNKSLTSASIDLQQMAEKIKIAQEKVKELSGDSEDQIVSNVNGIVTSIGCSAGDTVTKDTVVCTIEVPDMGHTLSFSVTNDQAQRLRVGDTATVSNYYWGKEIVATLTSIRVDPKNPQTNKELTFDLTGDVSSGSELTISVGQKSANYDVIIPNSSIRSDNNGKFVLAIQAKSSPLGNRYIAKRVSVEVLASDDNNSAVVADLGYGDYVITTSSSPVKSGDQVRMAESNG